MGDQRGSEEPQDEITHLEALSMNSALGSGTLSHRAYLSEYHIQTAAFFARQSAEMEREHRDKSWRDLDESGVFAEHRAYVTGAIFAAVAFLEATINELFADTADENAVDPVKQLPSDARALMRNLWRFRSFRRNGSTLDKFQTALDLNGKELFTKGQRPYQDVALLIDLRNDLIHFEPEWIAAGRPATQSELHKVEQNLRTKFPLNPLMPEPTEEHPFYPDKCLSHGCAEWAVKSSLAFANEFHARMGIQSRYERHGPFVTD